MGGMHSLAIDPREGPPSKAPLNLTQTQVDDLVEASVPDHVLYYVELNQPLLITESPLRERYCVVREALLRARDLGLVIMKDFVNFVCVKLLDGDRMETNQAILDLLVQVRDCRLTFPEALDAFP